MCTMSMVIDWQYDKWKDRLYPSTPVTYPSPSTGTPVLIPGVQLPSEREIKEFYDLLERAREYDRKHGEPDCEMAEKKAKLQELADEMGVTISFGDD